MWAAIVGSLILVICSGVGVIFWGHMTAAQSDAADANKKAHANEVEMLRQRAEHVEHLRKAEKELLEHKIEVANNFVRKSDHDSVVTEVFRKLENQDRQMANGFTALRTWLDTKFETIDSRLHSRQDRNQA